MDASEADEEDPLDAFMAGIDAEVRTASAAPPPRREEEEEEEEEEDHVLSFVRARAAGKAGVASARAPPPPRGFVRASADADRFPAGPLSAPPRSDAAYSARPDDLASPPPGSLARRAPGSLREAAAGSRVGVGRLRAPAPPGAPRPRRARDRAHGRVRGRGGAARALGLIVTGGGDEDSDRRRGPWRASARRAASTRALRALRRLGFDAPTPIQALALPALLAGRDVLGVAATGTGKTLAFVLPALAHCEAARRAHAFRVRRGSVRGPAALALAPTRELAAQTLAFARRFANARSERASTDLDRPPTTSTEASARRDPIACGACFGGADKSDQIRDVLRGACEFAVGTPGRALDLCRVRSLGYEQKTQTQIGGAAAGGGGVVTLLRGVTFVALDEADAMLFPLDSATARATRSLVSATSRHRVVAAFTATAPEGKVRDAVVDAFGDADADGGAFGVSDRKKCPETSSSSKRAPGRAGPSESEDYATEHALLRRSSSIRPVASSRCAQRVEVLDSGSDARASSPGAPRASPL